ncbi:MAG: glycolate oxidase subunit GlcF [Pseudomonadota bacterium]
MQTNITEKYRQTVEGQTAESILRACVHCGFCTATCPTYQLLGDELDGPRGRIYLIKQFLEGNTVSEKTQLHLDRCLTCRACETTCPSGVRYGALVDIGRSIVEREIPRKPLVSLRRKLLRAIIPHPGHFALLLKLGQIIKPLLPRSLKRKIPVSQKKTQWPKTRLPRQMLVLEGCVQSVVAANTNAAAARVLHKLGIQLLTAPKAGCCGAVSHHLAAEQEGLAFMRENIDAWWPYIEKQGVEAIVITASGCGAMVKDYGELLKDDDLYAEKAKQISQYAKDIGEILGEETLTQLQFNRAKYKKISFHNPCTLQHGQKLNAVVETILKRLGFELLPISDSHLCCGSAGTYSILQSELSQQLLLNKLHSLQKDSPEVIVTANIGCQMHLATRAEVPVKHWIELLDEANVQISQNV